MAFGKFTVVRRAGAALGEVWGRLGPCGDAQGCREPVHTRWAWGEHPSKSTAGRNRLPCSPGAGPGRSTASGDAPHHIPWVAGPRAPFCCHKGVSPAVSPGAVTDGETRLGEELCRAGRDSVLDTGQHPLSPQPLKPLSCRPVSHKEVINGWCLSFVPVCPRWLLMPEALLEAAQGWEWDPLWESPVGSVLGILCKPVTPQFLQIVGD